ncbi:F0F1 ATP synthase subunit epsilon [Weeksellaceae bacterium TAE3-ERU29]|nr:F0F1 ATP synthase subunit epsilon [Weeksellaceae bacterium TAE3-ERU29]
MGLKLEIITPEYVLFKGEVEAVTVPGKNGKFQMLQNHAPIVATLEAGDIIIKAHEKAEKQHSLVTSANNEFSLAISGGTLELNNNHLIILAD